MNLTTLITFQVAIEVENGHLAKRFHAAKLWFVIYSISFCDDVVCKCRKNWRLTSSFGFTKQNAKLIYHNWIEKLREIRTLF